jgi:hypothetical protein
MKFIEGVKRPAIAIVTVGLVAWGTNDVFASMVAGLLVERGLSTVIWLLNKK